MKRVVQSFVECAVIVAAFCACTEEVTTLGIDKPEAQIDPAASTLFVASGTYSRHMVSNDGQQWSGDTWDSPTVDPKGHDEASSAAALGTVIVLSNYARGLVVSDDGGKTWQKSAAFDHCSGDVITARNELFAVCGDSTWTSTDGHAWNETPTSVSGSNWRVVFADERFVAAGYIDVATTRFGITKLSFDGVTWQETGRDALQLFELASGAGIVVGTANGGVLRASRDGQTWTQVFADPSVGPFYGIVFARGAFLACAESRCLTSTDGELWSDAQADQTGFSSLTYGAGTFIGLRWLNELWSSADGAHWQRVFKGRDDTPYLSRLSVIVR